MSRISPEARILIDRLARMDLPRPAHDRGRIERALDAHFAALGLPARPIAWAFDPGAGFALSRRIGLDPTRDLAWAAARRDAERAAAASFRIGKTLVFAMVAIAFGTAAASASLAGLGIWIIPLAAYVFLWWSVIQAIRNGWGEGSVAAEIGVLLGSTLIPLLLVSIATEGNETALFALAAAAGAASAVAAVWARHLGATIAAGAMIFLSVLLALSGQVELDDEAEDDSAAIDSIWLVTLLSLPLCAMAAALGGVMGQTTDSLLGIGATSAGGMVCWGLGWAAMRLARETRFSQIEAKQAAIAEAWAAVGGDWIEEDDAWAGWALEPALMRAVLRAAAQDDGWGDDAAVFMRLAVEDAVAAVVEVNVAAAGRPGGDRLAAISAPLVDAYEAGLFVSWMSPDRIICVLRPALSIVEGRLHGTDAPAVVWPSGAGQWFRRGTHIPAWIMTEPERITLEAIQEETGLEIRRRMIEQYGASQFLRETGADLVHEDEFGRLWEAAFEDGDVWRVVEVENGTPEPDGTRRIYTLDVTGAEDELGWSIETARAAVAATYGLRPEQYRPEVRT